MSEVLYFLLEEEALLQIQVDACSSQESQDVICVIDVGLCILGEDDEVFVVHKAHRPTHTDKMMSKECGKVAGAVRKPNGMLEYRKVPM